MSVALKHVYSKYQDIDTSRTDIEFPVPPVCTANWDNESWQKWYFNHGQLKRIGVKVTTTSGNSWKTEINTDLEGAKKYFLGKYFSVSAWGDEKMEEAIKVELL